MPDYTKFKKPSNYIKLFLWKITKSNYFEAFI